MNQPDNFDLKKYLAENKLNEDRWTDEGYLEKMGPEFLEATKVIEKAWFKWKHDSFTPPSEKKPAKRDLMNYFDMILD